MAGPRVIFPPVHKNLIPEVDLYLKDVQETERKKQRSVRSSQFSCVARRPCSICGTRLPDCVIQFKAGAQASYSSLR